LYRRFAWTRSCRLHECAAFRISVAPKPLRTVDVCTQNDPRNRLLKSWHEVTEDSVCKDVKGKVFSDAYVYLNICSLN
jgi:hypothetical protein